MCNDESYIKWAEYLIFFVLIFSDFDQVLLPPDRDPLISLQFNLQYGRYGYLVEADIKGFFDNMDHDWLMDILCQRIDDKRFLNRIKQRLKVRIVEPDVVCDKPPSGSTQAGVISPVLADIYLHYALHI